MVAQYTISQVDSTERNTINDKKLDSLASKFYLFNGRRRVYFHWEFPSERYAWEFPVFHIRLTFGDLFNFLVFHVVHCCTIYVFYDGHYSYVFVFSGSLTEARVLHRWLAVMTSSRWKDGVFVKC